MTDWRDLVAEVPREPFLPEVIWVDGPGRTFVPVSRSEDPDGWTAATEGNQPVITQVDDGEAPGGPGELPTSSISMPSVVADMLDATNVQPGQSVLEIGTGTGWNAALLARRVGPSGRVVSVEIDPAVAEAARKPLAGVHSGNPASLEVITGDGEQGWPPGAPYDRVLATVAARIIPWAWIAQTRPGGLVVTPFGSDYANSVLARLTVGAGEATGRFVPGFAFMRLRSQRRYLVPRSDGDLATAEHSVAEVKGRDILAMISVDDAQFTIGVRVPDCYLLIGEEARGERHHVIELHDVATGSWAEIDVDVPGHDGAFDVHQAGPRRLWDEVLAAYRWWQANGEPRVDRFGMTVTPEDQVIWLDDPDGDHRWVLSAG